MDFKYYSMKLSEKYDSDMINWLKDQGKVQPYLKRLIRADMELEGVRYCPVVDPTCSHCDIYNGYCLLEAPEAECAEYIAHYRRKKVK